MFGAWEIVVILFVILLLFGGKKLPELARSLGLGIREFKKASREIAEEIEGDHPPVVSEKKRKREPEAVLISAEIEKSRES